MIAGKIWVSLMLAVGILSFSPLAMASDVPNGTAIKLWPATAPGSEKVKLEEQVVERSKQADVQDRAIMGITQPEIISLPADPSRANGTAVLICPGGAYARVTLDKEGYDIAKWLNQEGISAFILKYRLPGEGHTEQYKVPLQDAQRAMRIIRSNAAVWNINPQKIGVMGFSAGGHLASTLGTKYQAAVYSPVDACDQQSARPDFMVLLYPVISMQDGITHEESRKNLLGKTPSSTLMAEFSTDERVTGDTPPTFIAQAHNDGVSTENSVQFYLALKQAGVQAELHIFRRGGHGFGIRGAKGPIAIWPQLCMDWMRDLKIVSEK